VNMILETFQNVHGTDENTHGTFRNGERLERCTARKALRTSDPNV